jgi:hypothetical protein
VRISWSHMMSTSSLILCNSSSARRPDIQAARAYATYGL